MIFLKIFFSIWLAQKNTNDVKQNPGTVVRIRQRSTAVTGFWRHSGNWILKLKDFWR
jgi:hypothetical protein